jgi:uncharacterized repeat protein (TIGR03806 family)
MTADRTGIRRSGWYFHILCAPALLLGPATATAGRAEDPARADHAARRVRWSGSRIAGTPEPPAPYTVEPAFPYLKFEFPVVLVAAPGTPRVFLGDLKGRIWSFPDDPESREADLAIDLARLHPDLSALYGLAFHPGFDRTRFVYICYVRQNDQPDGTVVARFRASKTDPPIIDPGSEQIILRFWSGGHNGGCLAFGRDGCLYISTGDGTAPSPPDGKQTGQDCTDLLSSILRIDVDHPDQGRAYGVPADNPFVKTQSVHPEIWAFGFRNPWKMSFDRKSGDLWVGDVGWELWEMIDRVERGGNYGWSIMEGPQPVQPDAPRGPSPISPPAVAHPHSEAASITGGYVYHGRRLTGLDGVYVYGDFQTGTVWGLRHDGKTITWRGELARTPLHLVAFGETLGGELYLLDHDRTHQIYRLVPNPQSTSTTLFPRVLSQTGLFASTRDHHPAPGVIPYSVNVALWSDGATAERLLAVPGEGPISFDEQGYGHLPNGSVLVRTVSIELQAGKPESRRRIETQILHLEADAWRPYTYVWSDDQDDAVLADAGGSIKTLNLRDPTEPGGKRTIEHRIHARAECLLCHNPWVEKRTTVFGRQSASPLGLNSPQLNRDIQFAGEQVNQLSALHRRGLLADTPRPEAVARLADPYDPSSDLDRRARSYLQVNCAHCHQFNAGGTANIALGFELPLDQTRTIDARPVQGSFEIPAARIIAPGDPSRSVLYYRISKLGGGRMPRVGSNRVDERAARLIHHWIAAMPPGQGPSRDIQERIPAEDQAALRTLSSGLTSPGAARTAALRRLLSTTRGGLLLLGLLGPGPVPEDLRREVVSVARDNSRVEVRDLLERFVPDAERQRRLGDLIDRRALLSLPGDAKRGADVFALSPAAQCKTCHKLGSVGEAAGPDLSRIGAKYDRSALLDHIIEPSRTIDPQYNSYLVALKDGQVLTGLVVERTEAVLVLRDAQAKLHRLSRAEIEQLSPQARSLMPELLLRDLTPQQAADLLAFLAAQK